MRRTIVTPSFRVELDLRQQILSLWLPERCEPNDAGEPSPTLELIDERFVSAAVLTQKAKQFDDGLMATVQLLAQRGAGTIRGRAALLGGIARALSAAPGARGDAVEVVVAACGLAGVDVPVRGDVARGALARIAAFRADEGRSKPIGFYTWSNAHRRIYQQHRMLQSELHDERAVRAVAGVLRRDKALLRDYLAHLDLDARLTNPAKHPSLAQLLDTRAKAAIPAGVRFMPAAQSPEGALLSRRVNDESGGAAWSGDLLREMVDAVRLGEIDLTPTERSGWYDHKLWSLETLAAPDRAPEAARLQLSDDYREHLAALFEGNLALMRETHAADVEEEEEEEEDDDEPAKPIPISPRLTVEPLPTHYLRRAWSYRFVRRVLEEAFGDALDRAKRCTPDGLAPAPLAMELREMEALFRGACAAAWRELGVAPRRAIPQDWPGPSKRAAARFAAWRRDITGDADLARDGRMMVPIAFNPESNTWRVWIFLGWTVRSVMVSFARPPAARVSPRGRDAVVRSTPGVELRMRDYPLAEPVVVEAHVTRLLDRDELRRRCDRYKTTGAILRALR